MSSLDKPSVLLLEDEPLFVLGWETMLEGDAELLSYPSPEALLEALVAEPQLLRNVRVAIIDQFYGRESQTTGLDFAPALRAKLPTGAKIYLASTGLFQKSATTAVVDKVIDKVAVSYRELISQG